MRQNLLLLLVLALMAGCSANNAKQQADQRDPLEVVNRKMWTLNYDVLDKSLVRPAATGYQKLGTPVRTSVQNFLFNLEEPLNAVNNLLQGKVKDTGSNIGRFVINSTIGLLGIFDIASSVGLDPKREDFSQTLGSWGIGNGGYLMVPLYGPGTPRSVVGDVLDNAVFPMTIMNPYQILLTFVLSGIENRVQLFDQEPLLNQSLDPYNFVKEVYFQNDMFKVTDGKLGNSAYGGPDDGELFEFDDEILPENEIN